MGCGNIFQQPQHARGIPRNFTQTQNQNVHVFPSAQGAGTQRCQHIVHCESCENFEFGRICYELRSKTIQIVCIARERRKCYAFPVMFQVTVRARTVDGSNHAPPDPYEMTPLRNDSQQHRGKAKNLQFHVVWADPSLDLGFARTALQKKCIGSKFGPQTFDFTSNSGLGRETTSEVIPVPSGTRASGVGERRGGGTTTGAPKWTRVRPHGNQCTTRA
jgi:hypothetical protein